MLIKMEVGAKIFDLEEPGIWGIIWGVTRNHRGLRFIVRWADGSVTHGLHSSVLEDYGYALGAE